jgi:hypothetical protein
MTPPVALVVPIDAALSRFDHPVPSVSKCDNLLEERT